MHTGSPRKQTQGRPATPNPAVPDPAVPDQAEAENDPADNERGPLRRCIVTRAHGERAQMLRFVLGPDRMIVPDLAARLPGRGFWLSPRADVVEAARTRGAFARAARGPVSFPLDLVHLIRSGLARRVTDTLGLARRAGQAAAGFAKAREAILQGRAGAIVHALDGSEDECRRLLSGARDTPVVRPLTASELGAVFGRDHVVHVALAPGRLADALLAESFRLASMTGQDGDGATARNSRAQDKRRGDIERTGE